MRPPPNDMLEQFRCLLARARNHDQDAAREIYQEYAPHLLRLIIRRLHPALQPRLGADDILQSVFMRFFSNILPKKKFDTSPHLLSFLVAMVARRIQAAHRDNLGTLKRSVHLEQSSDETNVLASLSDSQSDPARLAEIDDSWESLIRHFPRDQQPIFRLLHEGNNVAEIADQLLIDKRLIRRAIRVTIRWFQMI